jgi:hypothetical protein
MHPGVAETAVIDTVDELTGQAIYPFAHFETVRSTSSSSFPLSTNKLHL